MLSEGNDMPPIELSALADGISYASSVFFAVLLYRRGMLTCGNLLRTFFAGMCAFIHFIAGPRGYAGLPFFYDWIAVDTPQSCIEVGQYVLRNLCFGAVAYPYLFLAKIFTSRRKILLTGDCGNFFSRPFPKKMKRKPDGFPFMEIFSASSHPSYKTTWRGSPEWRSQG